MSSLAGQHGGAVAGAHYAASKAGIIVLTKILAKELAGDGVTVNAVAPAAIEGPQLDAVPPERQDVLRGTIPVGRFGRADEVGKLVAFLASDAAGYITGATLDINGGLAMR
jgi:3-oxoacyl-[acyl-carrier protein] reductase